MIQDPSRISTHEAYSSDRFRRTSPAISLVSDKAKGSDTFVRFRWMGKKFSERYVLGCCEDSSNAPSQQRG